MLPEQATTTHTRTHTSEVDMSISVLPANTLIVDNVGLFGVHEQSCVTVSTAKAESLAIQVGDTVLIQTNGKVCIPTHVASNCESPIVGNSLDATL